MAAVAIDKQGGLEGGDGGEGGPGAGAAPGGVKDMPMIQFYSQLGPRGQEMIKYLKKYEFQEKKDNKYPTKAIQHLVKVLLDPTLRDHHHIVLQGMSYIVKHLSADCVEFLPVIIPPLMILIKTNDADLILDLYQCVNSIISSVPRDIARFADILFETVHEVLFTQSLQVLELIKLLNVNCRENLVTDMYLLLPKVLQLIECKRVQDIGVSVKAVNTVGEFHLSILDNHLYIIIPMLLRLCANGGVTGEELKLSVEVLRTIDTLKQCSSFREHMGQIIHSLLQLMETHLGQAQFVQAILELLSSMAERLTLDFAPYIPLVQKAIRRNKLAYERFDFQVEAIAKINPIQLFQQNMELALIEDQKEALAIATSHQSAAHNTTSQALTGHGSQAPRRSMMEIQEMRKKYVNFEQLLKEFDTTKCAIEADWIEWLKKTSHQLLK